MEGECFSRSSSPRLLMRLFGQQGVVRLAALVVEDAVRVDQQHTTILVANVDHSCRMLRKWGMVLQHRLLPSDREWLRGCFVLPIRNELLQRWRMLPSWVSPPLERLRRKVHVTDPLVTSYYCTVVNGKKGCCKNGKICTSGGGGGGGCVNSGYVPCAGENFCCRTYRYLCSLSIHQIVHSLVRSPFPHYSGRIHLLPR